ncbi:MAG: phospholipase D-like domain-containing protein [Cyclobacteriaceae bacterium]|nr:phospholipase D-like domain-containing protein [Cyclobacteriaceae bacterium]MDW8332458.1 phospholipase D-like domain-containing protein [Cyclobacteriaceae bacterium]
MNKTSPFTYPDYYERNHVRLIKGGAAYFDELENLIHRARYYLYLQVYIFEADETGQRIRKALERAAARGVFVHVLVDGYASQNLPLTFIQSMLLAGVHFRFFEPIYRSRYFYFGRRLHHKVTVADGRWALVGGINISNRYNDTVERAAWLDWAVWVEGEAATGLHNICAARALSAWRINPARLPRPPAFPLPDQIILTGIRVNDWVRRKNEITGCYLKMIEQANKELLIMSSYFFPGRKIRRFLVKAAQRGIRVRVVVAGYSDVGLAKHAERYMYRWMLKNRMEIYEYRRNVLHAKVAVCDDRVVTVGSYNLNEISERASVELNLEIADENFARHVRHRLEEIISRDCDRVITWEVFPWWSRFIQLASYRLIRFLLILFTFYFRQRE